MASCGLDPTLLLEGSRESSRSPDTESGGSVRLGVAEGVAESTEPGEEAKPASPVEIRTLTQLAVLR